MITIRSTELARLKVEADRFDRTIIRSLRKRIKTIGEGAVSKVREEVQAGSGGGSSAAQIAAGTGIRVSFAQRTAGVKITTTNARLDQAHKGFVAAFNKPSFRHPVYGNEGTWVTQTGRPYFGKVIKAEWDRSIEQQMGAALDDAVRALGGRIR